MYVYVCNIGTLYLLGVMLIPNTIGEEGNYVEYFVYLTYLYFSHKFVKSVRTHSKVMG